MINYIDNIDDLNKLCRFIKKNIKIIGIDTEFIRHFTYYPKLSLIQLGFTYKNEKMLYVIDVLNMSDIGLFAKILKSKKIKKVFFSFSQDLDAFLYYTKHINNIEDVQLIMEFSGYQEVMSYAKAIKEVLKINFKKDKAIQSGDWNQRPLVKSQLEYASDDAAYLLDLYYEVLKHISARNYKYYKNEIEYTLKFKKEKYLIKNAWKKSKFLLHKKTIEYMLLFKEIAKWREKVAIENNKIRSLILEDDDIDVLVRNKPRTMLTLKFLYGYKDILSLKKEYKIELVSIINNFYNKYSKSFGDTIFYMLEKGFPYKKKLQDLYKKVQKISKDNNIFLERTLSKTDLIFLLMNYEKKRSIIYGWKYNIFSNILNNK